MDRWPRVFHNLRATRQTELEQLYPTYAVCYWLGNSEAIARKHYLTVTDELYAKAAQNPAQSASVKTRTAETSTSTEAEDTLDSRNVSRAG